MDFPQRIAAKYTHWRVNCRNFQVCERTLSSTWHFPSSIHHHSHLIIIIIIIIIVTLPSFIGSIRWIPCIIRDNTPWPHPHHTHTHINYTSHTHHTSHHSLPLLLCPPFCCASHTTWHTPTTFREGVMCGVCVMCNWCVMMCDDVRYGVWWCYMLDMMVWLLTGADGTYRCVSVLLCWCGLSLLDLVAVWWLLLTLFTGVSACSWGNHHSFFLYFFTFSSSDGLSTENRRKIHTLARELPQLPGLWKDIIIHMTFPIIDTSSFSSHYHHHHHHHCHTAFFHRID